MFQEFGPVDSIDHGDAGAPCSFIVPDGDGAGILVDFGDVEAVAREMIVSDVLGHTRGSRSFRGGLVRSCRDQKFNRIGKFISAGERCLQSRDGFAQAWRRSRGNAGPIRHRGPEFNDSRRPVA